MRDFPLPTQGPLSNVAIGQGIRTFRSLCTHLRHLPYRRPFGKTWDAVLSEGCGTCSSKHALLKLVAEEAGLREINLLLCVFLMNENNTPAVKSQLRAGPLTAIPEMHTYCKWNDEIIDVTSLDIDVRNFRQDVQYERVVSLAELPNKQSIHKAWLAEWLQTFHSGVSLQQAWQQRELCILALSTPQQA